MSTIVRRNILSSCFDPHLTETTATLQLKVAAAAAPPPPNPKESIEKQSTWKSHFSRLSAESLELCTENLGSESGADTVAGIFPQSNPIEKSKIETKQSRNNRKIRSFPPPLTTMSGSSSLRVRRHREGGRLIIETVEAPPCRSSCLQAERSDGRLRLCLVTDETTSDEVLSEDELEIGVEKLQWVRCNEGGGHGNKGLCHGGVDWKPTSNLCVATS